jgi:signal transduction histidine kinase
VTFRTRLLAAFAVATAVPLGLLAVGVSRQLTTRLTAQHGLRVRGLVAVVGQDLARESAGVGGRLRTLARSLGDDNEFRLAIGGSGDARPYLLDWAEHAMPLAGLSMLQLQDSTGRILSSGHFRNEFDRLEPDLPRLVATTGDAGALVRARAPDGPFLALARVDSLRVAGRRFTLVGGVAVDSAFLARFARGGDVAVRLLLPDSAGADTLRRLTGDAVAAELPVSYVDARGDSARIAPARIVITHSLAELDALRRDVQRWFVAAIVIAVAGALALAAWLSARLSQPLAELAGVTGRIDLDGPDIELATGRDDEIGILARRLGAMTRRLRTSATRLRDAERRATVGDLARQVNHDIKNGLVPIRNVLRHLGQVQEQEPAALPGVFAERRSTLDSSVAYLDTLARSYARLTPRLEPRLVDVNATVRELAASVAGEGATIQTRLADGLPPVHADPVVLRRILENLLRNAIESLDGTRPDGAAVLLGTARAADGSVAISIADRGRGMTPEELAHAFDDFYTTKPGGTGLGLSVVRRLTSDSNGQLHIESQPGRGTTVTVRFPSTEGRMPR